MKQGIICGKNSPFVEQICAFLTGDLRSLARFHLLLAKTLAAVHKNAMIRAVVHQPGSN